MKRRLPVRAAEDVSAEPHLLPSAVADVPMSAMRRLLDSPAPQPFLPSSSGLVRSMLSATGNAACGRLIQRLATAGAAPSVGPEFGQAMQSEAGRGDRIPAQVRQSLESGLGRPLAEVRLHNNAASAAMAEQVHARAFTVGPDIYFGQGEYDTDSAAGYRLLAHEVTHTLQGDADRGSGAGGTLMVGSAGTVAERQADKSAEHLTAHRQTSISDGSDASDLPPVRSPANAPGGAGDVLQRQPLPSYEEDESQASISSPGAAARDPQGPLPPNTVVLAGFAIGSAELKPAHRAMLDGLLTGESLGARARIVSVTGYTDAIGQADRNQALRMRRAESVLAFFASYQFTVDPSGAGAGAPAGTYLAGNDTATDRAANRAVVIILEPLPVAPADTTGPAPQPAQGQDVDAGAMDAGVPEQPRDASAVTANVRRVLVVPV